MLFRSSEWNITNKSGDRGNVKANNGSYSLSLGAFEADTQKTTGEALAINGTSLNGTINADGTATVSIVFSPGSMPMPITAEFTGSNTQSSAQ